MEKQRVLQHGGFLLMTAITSTEDKRLTAGKMYSAHLVWRKQKSASGSHWRFLIADNLGELMTFDTEAFKPYVPA